jgi:uncharacterized protein YhfF
LSVPCDALDVGRSLTFGYHGDGGLGDRLTEAVLLGAKTATSSLAVEYATQDALPRVGEHLTLVDSHGVARGTVETTDVVITHLHLVGDDVARAEGEGFADAREWRENHVSFWADLADLIRAEIADPSWELREDEHVVVHRFRLIDRD